MSQLIFDTLTGAQKSALNTISDKSNWYTEKYRRDASRMGDQISAGTRGYDGCFKGEALSLFVRGVCEGKTAKDAYEEALKASIKSIDRFNQPLYCDWYRQISRQVVEPDLFWAKELFLSSSNLNTHIQKTYFRYLLPIVNANNISKWAAWGHWKASLSKQRQVDAGGYISELTPAEYVALTAGTEESETITV